MIGAIIGDICGSIYEYMNFEQEDIKLITFMSKFTDDTILTVAIADALLHNKNIGQTLKDYALVYPNSGYEERFKEWLYSNDLKAYNSYDNGAAMRVSSIPLLYNSLDKILEIAKETSIVTHNHIEGIKGAQAISYAIYLSKNNYSKENIKKELSEKFNYKLNDYIYTTEFNNLAETTVPNAILAFLNSSSFEDAILNAIKLKGDTDTIACMTGSIAESFYGLESIPKKYIELVYEKLPKDYLNIIKEVYDISYYHK